MLMEMKLHDYVAWAVALGAVVIFIILLCWDGYSDYKEEERRRLRRAQKEVKHG